MTNHQPLPTDPAIEQLDLFPLRLVPQLQCLDWAMAELEYRRFLSLKKCYPNQLLMPSGAAWQLWQAHVLDTRRYRSDCERLFSRFIDHFPYLGCGSPADRRERHFAEQLYQGLYARHFSIPSGALNN
ncbi:glycine-rich domain-containing protein [Pseudomonas sp. NPDC077408]